MREGKLATNPARWDAVGKVALPKGDMPKELRYLNPEDLLEFANVCHDNATKTPRIILGQVMPKPKPLANKRKDLVAPA